MRFLKHALRDPVLNLSNEHQAGFPGPRSPRFTMRSRLFLRCLRDLLSKRFLALSPALWALLRRYLRFGMVGASGIAVDMLALFLLADPKMLAWDLSLSKAIAAEIAIFSNFIGNELWTFGDRSIADVSCRGRAGRFGRFNLICLAGIGLSVLLLNLQTRSFHINIYAGNLVSILIVSLWNFGMNLRFGWQSLPVPAGPKHA
jgi:putative flippase GtrA